MNNREKMARLNAALNNIDSVYATIAKKHGLTFNSLMAICMIDGSDKVTQQQICEVLHLPKSTVHSITLGFVGNNLMCFKDGNNLKEKILVITPEGREHFAKALEDVRRLEDKVLSALGDDTCAFLIETAENLGDILNREIESILIGKDSA